MPLNTKIIFCVLVELNSNTSMFHSRNRHAIGNITHWCKKSNKATSSYYNKDNIGDDKHTFFVELFFWQQAEMQNERS